MGACFSTPNDDSKERELREQIGAKDQEIQELKKRVEELEPYVGRVAELEPYVKRVEELEPLQDRVAELQRCESEVEQLREQNAALAQFNTPAATPASLQSKPSLKQPTHVYLRVVALWDEQMGQHLRAGKAGLIDYDDMPLWKMSLNDPVLKLIKRIQTDFKIKLDREDVTVSPWRLRADGSLRPTHPWKLVGKTAQGDLMSTPLRTLLGVWVHEAPTSRKLESIVTLLCRSQYTTFERQLKYLFFRVYDAREGQLHAKWLSYNDEDKTWDLLPQLRELVGLNKIGNGGELQVWREGGPASAPTYTSLVLDWKLKACGELGFLNGDLLLIQRHPDTLPANLPHPYQAVDYLQQLQDAAGPGK